MLINIMNILDYEITSLYDYLYNILQLCYRKAFIYLDVKCINIFYKMKIIININYIILRIFRIILLFNTIENFV